MTHAVYTLLLGAVLTFYAPAAVARRLRHGVPLNLRARLGRDGSPPSPRRCGWVHAVSVGEAIAAAPLVEGLRRLYPDLPLVVTTVTETGAGVVRDRFKDMAVHRYFPLDLPGAARRVVDAINPAFFVCMETELWPNVLHVLARRGVPVMIANGRISDRSFRRYRLVRRLLRPMLAGIRVFAMRSDEDARRIIALGAAAERVVVTGNLKHEVQPDRPGAVDLWRRLLGLAPGQRVWIAGSTHRGEEEAVLEAHARAAARYPGLGLVLAPRHPERVAEVVALVRGRGWPAVRRTELPAQRSTRAVIVLDTVGELAQLYALGDVVFVGGSLVPVGGHNMLEPALRGKPVLYGPHTQNFREEADLLVGAGAARVVPDAAALGGEVERLLGDPDGATRMGSAGREAVASRNGAVRDTLELVGRFLHAGTAP